MKVLRQPVMMCYACGTVFEYDNTDIKTSHQGKMIVTCPTCNYPLIVRQEITLKTNKNEN
jgi:DNA-directed RNA polymerase subunit RPC12/RpoP